MSESLLVVLGLAVCTALVVTPLLVFGWLKRRHPRVHHALSYFLSAAFIWMVGTSLLFRILNAYYPNAQDDTLVVSAGVAGFVVGALLVFIYWKPLSVWTRKYLALSFLPRAIAAVLLVLAPFSLPEDFYLLLRWFVFGTATLVLFVALGRRQFFWVWLFAMVGLLFNPVKLFHFTHQEVWHTADVLSAGLFLLSCFFVSEKRVSAPPSAIVDAA